MVFSKNNLLLLILIMVSCKPERNENTENIKRVKAVKAEEVSYQKKIQASGTLKYDDELRLSFKTGGIVQNIYYNEGKKVKKGNVLATLELDEVNAKVNQAELSYNKAKRDYERIQSLYQDSVATLEQLQNAQTQLKAIESELSVARFNLRYSKIVAPATGIILRKLVSENELVGSGHPVLIFGSEEVAKVIQVNLTDKEIINVQLEDSASIRFDPFPGREFKGEISEIAGTADPYTNTYQVEITIKDPLDQLKSGFIGRALIFSALKENMIKIPLNAMRNASMDKVEIFVVENNKARLRTLSIDYINDDDLLIRNGLIPGEYVVTEGVDYIRNGENVQVVN